VKVGKLYRATKEQYFSFSDDTTYQKKIVPGDIVLLIEVDHKKNSVSILSVDMVCRKSYIRFPQWGLEETWNDFFEEIEAKPK